MNEPTTYALPDEPEGPVWDRLGKRWTPTDLDGWWLRDVTGAQCTWARVLEGYGPLTSVPPWKPEVGDTVETEEQYAALPEGSIVAADDCPPKTMNSSGNVSGLAGTPRTILRVGWES